MCWHHHPTAPCITPRHPAARPPASRIAPRRPASLHGTPVITPRRSTSPHITPRHPTSPHSTWGQRSRNACGSVSRFPPASSLKRDTGFKQVCVGKRSEIQRKSPVPGPLLGLAPAPGTSPPARLPEKQNLGKARQPLAAQPVPKSFPSGSSKRGSPWTDLPFC